VCVYIYIFPVFLILSRQMPAQCLPSSQATTLFSHIPYNSLTTTLSYTITLEAAQSLLIKTKQATSSLTWRAVTMLTSTQKSLCYNRQTWQWSRCPSEHESCVFGSGHRACRECSNVTAHCQTVPTSKKKKKKKHCPCPIQEGVLREWWYGSIHS